MAERVRANKQRAPSPRGKKESEPLGPGLHAAVIEMKGERSFRLRTAAGRQVTASLGEGVDARLVDECLRRGRHVIVADTEAGPAILGALQTSMPLEHDENGRLTLEARELRLRADQKISLEVGATLCTADKAGVVRFEGERMVIDMAALVRVLSSKVELP